MKDTKQAILNIIHPAYIDDVRHAIGGRKQWKRISDVCEAGSKVLAGVSSILAFSSGVYALKALAFASGCAGTVGIVLSVYSGYAAGESKERTTRLNTILKQLDIEPMPTDSVDARDDPSVPEEEIGNTVAKLRTHFDNSIV